MQRLRWRYLRKDLTAFSYYLQSWTKHMLTLLGFSRVSFHHKSNRTRSLSLESDNRIVSRAAELKLKKLTNLKKMLGMLVFDGEYSLPCKSQIFTFVLKKPRKINYKTFHRGTYFFLFNFVNLSITFTTKLHEEIYLHLLLSPDPLKLLFL